MKLALKIDIDTYRGTREGVPRLLELLRRAGAGATFLFSLGPDHTGRAIRRALRPGFLGKVKRTSVLEHYGLRTLLYGTLLPGPDIGLECAGTMRAVRDAGFEAGIHCWDHVRWQDGVADADAGWTAREFELARVRFAQIFGAPAQVHGAAGWQMNAHAFRQLDAAHMRYASDTRGRHPFLPVVEGERLRCAQLPTTLPTLDELLGAQGLDAAGVVQTILGLTAKPAPHVYTAHAELEGGKLAGSFSSLLQGWQRQGYELVSLQSLASALDLANLPHHAVVYGPVPGRSGSLALQGKEITP